MNGNLYKWEGYLSGWSLYYFVLQNGSLCYYKNKVDFENTQPAKDEINMGLCEIIVDKNTTSQFELKVAAESKVLCLKTEKQADRAIWIRALGSAKACLLSINDPKDGKLSENYAEKNIKLEENENIIFDESYSDSFDSAQEESYTEGLNSTQSVERDVVDLSNDNTNSNEILDLNAEFLTKCNVVKESISALQQEDKNNQFMKDDIYSSLEIALQELLSSIEAVKNNQNMEKISNNLNAIEVSTRKVDTFFSTLEVKFSDVNNQTINNGTDFKIPVSVLLDACSCYQDFFDHFGGTLLSPIKTDLVGNIAKIRNSTKNSQKEIIYLQDLIQHDIALQDNTGPNTGTQALLWMNRGLRVMANFLHDMLAEASSTYKIAPDSFVANYSKFLAKHHNWVVQRLFKAGMKMLPTYHDFVECMTSKEDWKRLEANRDVIYAQIHEDGIVFANNLITVTDNICSLFGPLNMEL